MFSAHHLFLYRQNFSTKHTTDNSYVIACIGESTTALGGSNSYPKILEALINKNTNGNPNVLVYNWGIPGCDTTKIISYLKAKIPKTKPDKIGVKSPNSSFNFKIINKGRYIMHNM